MPITTIEVYPKKGETYPDANGVPITSVGAVVSESKYIEDAIRDGFLLTWDPLEINEPDDRTSLVVDAPSNASYIVASPDAILTNELVLTQGPGITLTPGPGTMTVAASVAAAPVGAQYVTLASDATLTAERVLTAGSGISITPAAGTVTIASTVTAPVQSVFSRVGNVVATLGDYTSALVSNVSAVAGATVSAALEALQTAIGSLSTTVGTKAPNDAEYLVSTASAALSAERVLTAGPNITLTPAAGTLTIAASGGAAPTAQFITLAADASLPNERVLTAGGGIAITDGGAGAAATVSQFVKRTDVNADTTLTVAHAWNVIFSQAAGTVTITIPTNATAPIPVGSKVWVVQAVNPITVVAVGGVNLYKMIGTPSTTIAQFDVLQLLKISPDEWVLSRQGIGDAPKTASYVTLAADTTLTNERVLTAGSGISITDGGAGGAVTLQQTRSFVAPAAGAYTLLATDAWSVVGFGGAVTVTIPPDASVNYPLGTRVWLFRGSAGAVTVAGGSGVTLLLPDGASASCARLYSEIWVYKYAANSWVAGGDLTGLGGGGAPTSASYLTLAADSTLTSERVLTIGSGLAFTDGGAGGAYTLSRYAGVSSTASTAFTFNNIAYAYYQVDFTAGTVTATIPDNATVPFPIGSELYIRQGAVGAGQVSIVGAGSVAVNVPVGYFAQTRAQHSIVTARKVGPDSWVLFGDLYETIGYIVTSATSAHVGDRVLTAGPGIGITDGGAGGAVTVAQNVPYVQMDSAALTLALPDAWKHFGMAAAGSVVTVPTNASVPFQVGTRIWFQQGLTGPASQVSVVAAGGVTLYPPTGRSAGTRTDISIICLYKVATDTWLLSGDLADTTAHVTVGNTGTLSNERALTAGAGISITDGGAGGAVTLAQNIPFIATNSTAYTPPLSDAWKLIYMQQPGAYTLPTDAAVPFPVGTELYIQQATSGHGSCSIVGAAGVSVYAPAGFAAATRGPDSRVCAYKASATAWLLSGDLAESVPYVTVAATAMHSAERVLTAGTGISLTDGGAGGALTISATGGGASVNFSIVSFSTASLTLDGTHAGKLIICTKTDGGQLVIPRDSTLDLPIGFTCTALLGYYNEARLEVVSEVMSGTYGIPARYAAEFSDTGSTPYKTWGDPYVTMTLVKIGADAWLVSGND